MRIVEKKGGVIGSTAGHESAESEMEFEKYLEFFSAQMVVVRYIFVRDSSASVRAEWVRETFGEVRSYEFSDNATHCLTNADGDFDILIIGCHDVSRVKAFLRANAPLLENKVKLCLLHAGNVQRRARALSAGFDDVFDIGRVLPTEGRARAFAIWRRYKMAITRQEQQESETIALNSICDVRRVTPRQLRAIEYLAKHKNRLVPYRNLSEAIGSGEVYISDANLKVIICHLRKQLRPGYRITSQHNFGYILKSEEGI